MDRATRLRLRIELHTKDAKWCADQAAACRKAACIKSAMSWDLQAANHKAYALAAKHELEGLKADV